MGGPCDPQPHIHIRELPGNPPRQEVIRNRTVLTPSARAGLFRWTPPGSAAIQEFDIAANDPRGKGIDPQMSASHQILAGSE